MRLVNNLFLTNITVSNLVYTLFAPFPFIMELQNENKAWIFFDFMCPIIPFLNTVAINLNTLTMIVSSVDRLIQIICPLRTKLSKKKFSFIILIIWIFSILLSLPWNFLIKVEEKNSITGDIEQENIDFESSSNDESIKLCAPQISYHHILNAYFLILCVIQYFLPLIVLSSTFCLISYYLNVINARRVQNDANKLNENLRKKNEKKVK